MYIIQQNNLYGCANAEGGVILPCIWEKVEILKNKLFIKVYRNKKYGLWDISGKEILGCVYDSVHNFKNGVTISQKRGVAILYTTQNLYSYQSIGRFKNGFMWVQRYGKYGFLNSRFHLRIPCIYDEVFHFHTNGFARAKLNGKWGLIDAQGQVVLPFQYDFINGYQGDFAQVSLVPPIYPNAPKKHGFINLKGELVVPCIYDKVAQIQMQIETGNRFYYELNDQKGYLL